MVSCFNELLYPLTVRYCLRCSLPIQNGRPIEEEDHVIVNRDFYANAKTSILKGENP